MAEPVALKYRAFISYSHANASWAKYLHRALEGFRIDKDLVGRETATGPIPKSLRPIFRDRDDFTAGHTLTGQTLAALDASHALIVVCSPSAAKSQYVTEEIRLFKSRHPERPVIPLIVGGKPSDPEFECFPASLKFKLNADGQITTEPTELLAADIREEGDGKSLAVAKMVAGTLGISSDDVFRRAERERRRKGRVRNGVITALVILVVTASGSAVYALQQLKTNEAFLAATLKTATEIVDEAVAQSENYGVPRRATLALLTKAEGLFDNMALLSGPTQELRYQKAWMLIQFARNYKILGDAKKWDERVREAHRLLTELVFEEPESATFQWTLAGTLEALGNLLMAKGDLAAARKSYQDVLGIMERVAQTDPSNTMWQHDLGIGHARVGDILLTQNELAGALKSYQAARAIMSRLVEADPTRVPWQRDLSFADDGIGDVLMAQGHLAEALTLYQGSLAIRDRVSKADPNNASWQHDRSISYMKIGDVLVVQRNLAEGLAFYQDSLAIRDRLSKADPDNAIWQRTLAMSFGSIGLVLAQQGETIQALDAFRRGREIIATLEKPSPYNAMLPKDLAWYDAEIEKLEQGPLLKPGMAQPQPPVKGDLKHCRTGKVPAHKKNP